MSEQPLYITRRNLARRWNTSVQTIIRRERAGRLTPRKLMAATVRYSLDEVKAIENASDSARTEGVLP